MIAGNRQAKKALRAVAMLLVLLLASLVKAESIHTDAQDCPHCHFAVLGHRRSDLVASVDSTTPTESHLDGFDIPPDLDDGCLSDASMAATAPIEIPAESPMRDLCGLCRAPVCLPTGSRAPPAA